MRFVLVGASSYCHPAATQMSLPAVCFPPVFFTCAPNKEVFKYQVGLRLQVRVLAKGVSLETPNPKKLKVTQKVTFGVSPKVTGQ